MTFEEWFDSEDEPYSYFALQRAWKAAQEAERERIMGAVERWCGSPTYDNVLGALKFVDGGWVAPEKPQQGV